MQHWLVDVVCSRRLTRDTRRVFRSLPDSLRDTEIFLPSRAPRGPCRATEGDEGGRTGCTRGVSVPCRRARPDEANVAFFYQRELAASLLCSPTSAASARRAATLRPVVGGGSTVQNDLMNGIFHSGSLIIPGTYFLPSAIYFRN